MDSILSTIKKMLGLDEAYTAFDTDIIININSAFMILNQLGLGPAEGYSIHDANDLWSDFLGASPNLEAVKTYIFLKVQLVFDPPTSSYVMESKTRTISELEWRLMVQAEPVV